MKPRIFVAAATVLLILLAALTSKAFMNTDRNKKADDQGHALSSLWKDYYAAEKADLPKKMAEVLETIKKEAKAKRYHWDFYDAARKKVDAEVSRNWKVRQEKLKELAADIESYDEPIVTYAFRSSEGMRGLDDFAITNRARLQSGRNASFYSRTAGKMNGLLNSFIKDDYEYALWAEKASGRNSSKVAAALKECVGDTYPNAAWLEYTDIADRYWEYRKDQVDAFIVKYKGKAISLFGKSLEFEDRMIRLSREKAGEDAYKALYADIQAAEKERKSYTSGVDGRIAGTIDDFKVQIENLERKEVEAFIEGNTIVVALRNLDKVEVRMLEDAKDGKTILERTLTNPKNSFYVMDTVKVDIPKCDDGEYVVRAKNGKLTSEASYSSKTLSIAMREDADGKKFYVADYITGEPLKEADLALYLSGKVVASAKGVKVDGFTPVPDVLVKAIDKDAYYYLEASSKGADGFLRRSKQQGINNLPYRHYSRSVEGTFCNIFTDKGAYNPGETIKYKAVLYEGNMQKAIKVLGEGKSVEVSLVNTEGKEVAKAVHKTNEYGSVAGGFLIPEGERNGSFSVEVRHGSVKSSRRVVVDEFVLPTYDLQFEEVDSLYFMGDEIEVKGKVSSYSGHPLDAAEVSYEVEGWGRRVADGEVELGDDGSFAIRFPTVNNVYWYSVTIRVKDATGETLEFSRGVFVIDSFHISIDLGNPAEGGVNLSSDDRGRCRLLSENKAKLTFTVFNNDGHPVPVPVEFELKDSKGKVLDSGTVQSEETRELDVPGPGLYKVLAKSTVKATDGREISSKEELAILRLGDSDKVLEAGVESVFKLVGPCSDGSLKDGEVISVQIGAGDGPVWAVVELFGDRKQPLGRKLVHLEGKTGEPGSLETVSFEYRKEYPDALWFTVFYFRKETHFTYQREFRREKDILDLPLSFSSFQDKALPGKEYSFVLQSDPGTEILAAVFDKSFEAIASNHWPVVRLMDMGADNIYYEVQDGSIDRFGSRNVYDTMGNGRKMMKTRAAGVVTEEALESVAMAAPMMEDRMDDSAEYKSADEAGAAADEVNVRTDFSTSLAFEPFLRTDAKGRTTLKFRTSDKLSTFVVQVYAHTKDMKNALLRKEMVVSIPVKVNVAEPGFLYKGDRYVLHATVSSNVDSPTSGTVVLQAYPSNDFEGKKPFATLSKKVTVPAKGSVPVEFELKPGDYDDLGLKLVFSDNAKTFSDGVFVSVPVLDAEQTLTEAHSAVLLSGMDKDALIRTLQSRFTGTTSKGAEYKEIDIRQMLLDAIPSKVDPDGKDVLSLSEALYVRKVAAKLGSKVEAKVPDEELVSKILVCRNADGGFGWFQGMHSSPVITAVLLERFAKLRDAGLGAGEFDPDKSVAYLDRNQFIHGEAWPYWSGWLSMAQYAYVRSMYASVPFYVSRETLSEASEYSKNFREFKKAVKDYLIPSEADGRGLKGQILAKARRIKTLLNMVDGEGGKALASAWGIKFNADSKMRSSIAADAASLHEYAVEHRDGGWYYPNAVMPWRGLLESELYAHSLLCDLLSVLSATEPVNGPTSEGKRIADGIRIWIMLQKETQQWADDPAFVDAINSVMTGGEDVLSTRVILMTKTYRKPFSEIVAAGNGFTVERHFYKEVLGENSRTGRLEIYPGMKLSVGDKLICEYRVWNQENRSFVKLTAPREAAFRPVDQLSGHVGWWYRPVGGMYSVTPQGYRNVKTDRTEYFFDVYPEENTTVTEEFFITQEGTFTAPVVTIESLYAPHYRANDKFGGQLKVYD